MSVGITVFDGAECIGGNKIYLEFKSGKLSQKGVFFDFGTNFKKFGKYYEEFLIPRTGRGIHDLIDLKLIPKISCYRSDLIPSDISLKESRKLNPLAVFISHAHMDHMGNIGLLDRNIPIIASPLSAMIMKSMQDCGSKMDSEVVYNTPRITHEEDGRLIETTNYQKHPYLGRDFYITPCESIKYGDALSEFSPFWCSQPTSRKFHPGHLATSSTFCDLEFQSYEVDHSMYGASAFSLETDSGTIVYSGDIRLHGKFGVKTFKFATEAAKLTPKLLIIEGTRASRKEREESEEEVYKNCLSAVEAAKKLVIADFSARNFERLDIFRQITEKTERYLVVLIKDAYILQAMQCADGIDRMKNLLIYRDLKTTRDGYEKCVFTQYSSKLIDPLEIAKNPDKYIICFSFFDIKHLLDIKTDGGTYIYSSSEAFSEEQRIDFQRLWNWLQHFKFDVKGFSLDMTSGHHEIAFEQGYHASGHASGRDLINIIKTINPEIVMPVHTENPTFFVESLPSYDVVLPEEGKEIILR